MDKFVRIEKPFQAPRVATKPKSEPATNPDDSSTTPKLEEWPDIASADRAKVDVSQLSSDQIEDILKSEPATNPDDSSTTPKLEEWPDIASADRAKVDVSQLSSDQIEDILRLFDLNPTYGPFVGVDRLFRWQRAEKWGLEPLLLIKDLIETERALSRPEAGSRW